MILYFSGTGNSLYVARRIAEATGEALMPMADAVGRDLRAERVVGLVYPSYDFNAPPAVRRMAERLQIGAGAYVFIVVTCGAQTGNSVWAVRRRLKRQGVRVAYCHKVRMPDNSAVLFGRNPNEQLWKLEKYASRLDGIIADIRARRRGNHFGAPGLAGWLMGWGPVERRAMSRFRPVVDASRCVGCGLCVRVCPVGNMALAEGGKARVGEACTACLACLHACPHQAIGGGGKAVQKASQYRHPQVELKSLLGS